MYALKENECERPEPELLQATKKEWLSGPELLASCVSR